MHAANKGVDAASVTLYLVQDAVRRRDPQIVRLNFNYRFGKADATLFKRRNNRTEDASLDAAPGFQ